MANNQYRISDEMLNAMMQAYCDKPGNITGALLHVVIDDGNHEEHFVRHCLERAKAEQDEDAVLIAEQLLRLTDDQRNKLLNPF